MRALHLFTGVASLAAFLASGLYMRWLHASGAALDETVRMLLRSTHIYLLFAALLNLTLGLYLPPPPAAWRRRVRLAGSLLILAAPPLIGVGFMTEPWLTGLERPYSRWGIYASLAGVVLHAASAWRAGRASPTANMREGDAAVNGQAVGVTPGRPVRA
jgi:hypothetical protein